MAPASLPDDIARRRARGPRLLGFVCAWTEALRTPSAGTTSSAVHVRGGAAGCGTNPVLRVSGPGSQRQTAGEVPREIGVPDHREPLTDHRAP